MADAKAAGEKNKKKEEKALIEGVELFDLFNFCLYDII